MKYLSSLFLILLFLSACNTTEQKPDINISIIETTDVHGRFFPFDLVKQKESKGSLSQVFSYIQALRKHDSISVVLLDNGDLLQGTPIVYYANYVNKDSCEVVAEMLNFMQYDAQTVGNHDIEAGHGVYDSYREALDFPLLAANAIDSISGEPYFKPYTIIERQGVKIAILGLITPSIPNWLPESLWSGIYFEDMVESARKWMKIIKEKEKPEIIVGLFHAGLNAEYGGADPNAALNENASLLVAKQVAGFDIIFSGHDHHKTTMIIKNIDSAEVLILNAGSHANNIAQANIKLQWNDQNQSYEKAFSASLVSMENILPDSNFLSTFDWWFDSAKVYVEEEIAFLDTDIKAQEALYGPSAFVDMIHQAQLDISGADISFAAPFSTNTILSKGIFTRADLFKLYRYENFLCTIELSGAEIKKYLEYSTDLWFDSVLNSEGNMLLLNAESDKNNRYLNLKNAYYNFDSGAGLRYLVYPNLPKGSKISIVSMADNYPFDMEKVYTVVMNSYRVNGGGGHLTKGVGLSKQELKSRFVKCSKDDFRNLLGEWLSKQSQPYQPKSFNTWQAVYYTKPITEY